MKNEKLLRLVFYSLTAGMLIFLVFFTNFLSFERYLFIREARESAFSKLSFLSSFVLEIKKSRDLIQENLALKEDNRKLISELALQSELKERVEFLNNALDLESVAGYTLTEARTYNLQFTPEGHYLLVNKGRNDGIKEGDTVTSSSGILLGRTSDIFENYSRVILITDPDLKITVKILRNGTAAIARGMLNDSLQLDFISQNDEIIEGDVVATSGNDLFPPGLTVGHVNKIGSGNGDLFKKIEVLADFKNINLSRVLIIGSSPKNK